MTAGVRRVGRHGDVSLRNKKWLCSRHPGAAGTGVLSADEGQGHLWKLVGL